MSDVAARVARARELAREAATAPGALGAYLHGSSARPYGDASSDLDIILVADADGGTPQERVWRDGRKAADISATTRARALAPALDIEFYRWSHAIELFDHTGTLTTEIRSGAQMTDSVRERRLRLSFYEGMLAAGKSLSAAKRGQPEAVRIAAALATVAFLRVLFFAKRAWPPPVSWYFEEIKLLDIPNDLIEAIRTMSAQPDSRAHRMVRGKLDPWLIEQGIDFVRDPAALHEWLQFTEEGRETKVRWGWMAASW
jgi:predicted nucleotidyltransferase